MNRFDWQDYTHEHAALVASWLNADTVRTTGLDEGFDAFHQYWKNESSPERGEYFWSKLVSENGHLFAVISYGYYNGTVTIMEIVVDPVVRGQGKGTAVISEFLNNAAAWIAQPITVFNAVVFQRNTASQIAFYKAGFVLEDKDQERWKRTVNDSEILFRYTKRTLPSLPSTQIRWLRPDERRLFNAHLRLCSQNTLSIQKWNGIMKTGVRYCGLFVDNKMIARACIEKLTDRYWEISDVRVAQEYRDRGYATAICGFVANEIIKSGRIPTIRTVKTNTAMLKVIEKLHFHPFVENAADRYICKIASLQEMEKKWDYEIKHHPDQKNWILWKAEAIKNDQTCRAIPYYGILDGTIICEATAMLDPAAVQNSAGLVDAHTAYLCAFRTVSEYRGLGYFSKLFHFMIGDLRQRGYNKVTLGVEPEDEKNLKLYRHWGFTEHIKTATEQYPDGTVMEVEYYGRAIDN